MTSSWALQKRKENPMWRQSNFSYQDSPLGGWEDSYVTPGATHECHPDFKAIPIGNPYGFMMCVRRRPNGKRLDVPLNPIDPSMYNGYWKFSADLYRPWLGQQIQMYDPYGYTSRTTQNESYLHREDYLARDIVYNGTGIFPTHTPLPENQKPLGQYGFSYTPSPPAKYDITRLQQAYPVWKSEQKHIGVNSDLLDEIDQNYSRAIL